MQALELEVAALARPGHHGGDGQGVVGGEGGEQAAGLEHRAGAGHVGDVGGGLAGEHRVIGMAPLLTALDLAVPVGALDQPHHDPAAGRHAQRIGPLHHGAGAALVGLDGHAQAIPASQTGVSGGGLDDVQAHLQPLAFLGVDGETDAAGLCGAGQLDQAAGQFRHGAVGFQRLVARVQGRELHRDAVLGEHLPACLGGGAGGADGVQVGVEIAVAVVGSAGGFAEHVEGIAERAVGAAVGAFERLVDVAAQHERLAHPLHGGGDAGADGRLAQTGDGGAQGPAAGGGVGQGLGQDQPEGSAVDQHRVGPAQVRAPVAAAQLVADQGVGRAGVGDAQIGLGQAQQGGALLAGEAVFLQEAVDPAATAGGPQGGEQGVGSGHGGGAFVRRQARGQRQIHQGLRLASTIQRRDGRAGFGQLRVLGQGGGVRVRVRARSSHPYTVAGWF